MMGHAARPIKHCPWGLLPQKRKQVGSQAILVRGEQTVRRVLIFQQLGVWNTACRRTTGRVNRDRFVGGSMDDKRWDGERGQVRTKVGCSEGFCTGKRRLQARLHSNIERIFHQLVADGMGC